MYFRFEHDRAILTPFLLEVIRYIETELLCRHDELLLNRCKFILMEFCINGIKHSGKSHSDLDIYIKEDQLIIEKRDHGSPFYPKVNNKPLFLPLPDAIHTVTLMEDDINRLNMQRIDEYCVRFSVEDTSLSHIPDQKKINEHFGLIIICRSSDNFTYRYHQHEGLNIFKAAIQLI